MNIQSCGAKVYNFIFHPMKQETPGMAVASLATQIALGILLTFIATVVAGPMAGSIVGTLYSFTITAVGIYDYFERKGGGGQVPAPANGGGGGGVLRLARRPAAVAGAPQRGAVERRPIGCFIEDLRRVNKGEFVGTEKLKRIQGAHLQILQEFERTQQWDKISGKEVSDSRSHFDWWMLPVCRHSSQWNKAFELSDDNIATLKADAGFMASYQAGVALIARSWKLDIATGQDIQGDREPYWRYSIRISKMLSSLHAFGEEQSLRHLTAFIQRHGIAVEPWARQYFLN